MPERHSAGNRSLAGAEHRYSNIEREVLDILHGLEKFHHYCFAREVLIITDHIPLVVIFKRCGNTITVHTMHSFKKFINTGSRLYANLVLRFSLQIGCPNTTMRRGKTSPSKIWIIRIAPYKVQQPFQNITNPTNIRTGWTPTTSKKTL